jgi:hypothetical protein
MDGCRKGGSCSRTTATAWTIGTCACVGSARKAFGLANATLVSTPDNAPTKNTYPWSVNALSVMAQSRFRLPAKPKRFGWEQRELIGTTSADLFDGDTYSDEEQKAVNMVMNQNQMFCVHQPERVEAKSASFTWNPGDAKNIVFDQNTGSSKLVTLNATDSEVPDGTVVRIYRKGGVTDLVQIRFGTGIQTNQVIDAGKMGESVFMGGKWRSTMFNVAFVEQP